MFTIRGYADAKTAEDLEAMVREGLLEEVRPKIRALHSLHAWYPWDFNLTTRARNEEAFYEGYVPEVATDLEWRAWKLRFGVPEDAVIARRTDLRFRPGVVADTPQDRRLQLHLAPKFATDEQWAAWLSLAEQKLAEVVSQPLRQVGRLPRQLKDLQLETLQLQEELEQSLDAYDLSFASPATKEVLRPQADASPCKNPWTLICLRSVLESFLQPETNERLHPSMLFPPMPKALPEGIRKFFLAAERLSVIRFRASPQELAAFERQLDEEEQKLGGEGQPIEDTLSRELSFEKLRELLKQYGGEVDVLTEDAAKELKDLFGTRDPLQLRNESISPIPQVSLEIVPTSLSPLFEKAKKLGLVSFPETPYSPASTAQESAGLSELRRRFPASQILEMPDLAERMEKKAAGLTLEAQKLLEDCGIFDVPVLPIGVDDLELELEVFLVRKELEKGPQSDPWQKYAPDEIAKRRRIEEEIRLVETLEDFRKKLPGILAAPRAFFNMMPVEAPAGDACSELKNFHDLYLLLRRAQEEDLKSFDEFVETPYMQEILSEPDTARRDERLVALRNAYLEEERLFGLDASDDEGQRRSEALGEEAEDRSLRAFGRASLGLAGQSDDAFLSYFNKYQTLHVLQRDVTEVLGGDPDIQKLRQILVLSLLVERWLRSLVMSQPYDRLLMRQTHRDEVQALLHRITLSVVPSKTSMGISWGRRSGEPPAVFADLKRRSFPEVLASERREVFLRPATASDNPNVQDFRTVPNWASDAQWNQWKDTVLQKVPRAEDVDGARRLATLAKGEFRRFPPGSLWYEGQPLGRADDKAWEKWLGEWTQRARIPDPLPLRERLVRVLFSFGHTDAFPTPQQSSSVHLSVSDGKGSSGRPALPAGYATSFFGSSDASVSWNKYSPSMELISSLEDGNKVFRIGNELLSLRMIEEGESVIQSFKRVTVGPTSFPRPIEPQSLRMIEERDPLSSSKTDILFAPSHGRGFSLAQKEQMTKMGYVCAATPAKAPGIPLAFLSDRLQLVGDAEVLQLSESGVVFTVTFVRGVYIPEEVRQKQTRTGASPSLDVMSQAFLDSVDAIFKSKIDRLFQRGGDRPTKDVLVFLRDNGFKGTNEEALRHLGRWGYTRAGDVIKSKKVKFDLPGPKKFFYVPEL